MNYSEFMCFLTYERWYYSCIQNTILHPIGSLSDTNLPLKQFFVGKFVADKMCSHNPKPKYV